MVFRIPRKVPRFKLNIKGAAWIIYIVTKPQYDKINPEIAEVSVMGLTDGNTHSIYILSEYPRDAVMQTLWHELTHAFLSDVDPAKGRGKNGDNLVPEEVCAEAVAIGFLSILPVMNLIHDFVNSHIKDVEDENE